ncbi:MAG: hypothetical protein Q4F67_14325, partial [Propionibacteriaceae bacterium]|nr:hypothetical protein [Propionibacteriaceae bacterium]
MTSPLSRLANLFARPRKGVANASAVSAITLGVVGVMIGTGVASTAIGVSDGITWLTDSAKGEVLQYNPSTKRVERAYQVGRPGDPIAVAQGNGVIALRNERTGEVITVDMSKLQAGGSRATGDSSKVIVAKGIMVVLDGEKNTLTRVDPVLASDMGVSWSPAGGAIIADAVADDEGTIWVISSDGMLRALVWEDAGARFLEKRSEKVDLVGDDAYLTAHEAGVTVYGPKAGVLAQIGTRNDGYRQSNQLVGIGPAGANGPANLVPGSLISRSAVVILDRGQVRQVATGSLGCPRPTSPVAFNETVYVVCQGSQKVIRLTRDGRVAGPAITTPGQADAEPVTDEGRLLLNVSGATEGIEIDRSGATHRFDRVPLAGAQPIQVAPGQSSQGLSVGRNQAREDLNSPPTSADGQRGGAADVTTNTNNLNNRTEVVGEKQNSAPAPDVVPPAPAPLPDGPTAPVPGRPQPAPGESGPARPATPGAPESAPARAPESGPEDAPEPPGESPGPITDPTREASSQPRPTVPTLNPDQEDGP